MKTRRDWSQRRTWAAPLGAILAVCTMGVAEAYQLTPASRPSPAVSAPADANPGLPDVSYEDLWYLMKLARRQCAAIATSQPTSQPVFWPPSLAGLRATIHLTLRSNGRAVAEAEATAQSPVDATTAAAGALVEDLKRNKKFVARLGNLAGGLDELGFELEWIGEPQFLAAKFEEAQRWSPELLASFEPGIDGVGVRFDQAMGRTRPSVIVASNFTTDLALAAAEANVRLTHDDKKKRPEAVTYFRFRTHHVWQATAADRPVVLIRGMTPVSIEGVTPEALDAAIHRMGGYLRYRQNSGGYFAEEYLPTSDRNVQVNSAPIQLTALQGLAAYGNLARNRDVEARVMKGVDATLPHLKPMQRMGMDAEGKPAPVPAGLVLSFQGHGGELETSARFLDVLLYLHGERRFDDQRRGLIDGLLASQDEDGSWGMRFNQTPAQKQDPNSPANEDDAAAGLALQVVCRAYQLRNDDRIAKALGRSVVHARGRVMPRVAAGSQPGSRPTTSQPETADAAGASAWALAVSEGYAISKDVNADDVVFSVADRLIACQVNRGGTIPPDLEGGFDVTGRGHVGADSARYLPVLTAGLRRAQQTGDQSRERAYRQGLRAGIRFVLQLEFREPECYYVQTKRDVVGGIRGSPWDNRVRVDRCAEALMGLMAAREALYGRAGQGT